MASIFIPLTFLAGIYGMNFQHMPEHGDVRLFCRDSKCEASRLEDRNGREDGPDSVER
jgi:hypothetical protein